MGVKRAWTVISVFLLVHALLMGGFCIWLYTSGRLDRARLARMVDLFAPTLVREEAEEAKAQRLAEEAEQRAATMARLEAVEAGPISLTSRMETGRQVQEHAKAQLQRYREDVAVLRTQITGARKRLLDERADFEAEKKAFQGRVEAAQATREEEDFSLTVSMYEQVKPKQAKQMFQELLAQGRTPDVVNYLAAMNLRKAAAILRQFRTEDEIAQASHLLEMLRSRGVDPTASAPTDAEPSS